MSNFRVNCNPDSSTMPLSQDYHPHHPRHMTKTILKCGKGNAGPVCRDSDRRRHFDPYCIASLSLDTRGMMNPTVKIDFSSIISFKTTNTYYYYLNMVFRLSKVCHGGNRVTLGEWTFKKASWEGGRGDDGRGLTQDEESAANRGSGGSRLVIEESNSFCFNCCDCDDCPDCCRYVVEVIDYEERAIDGQPNISNIDISGMAVGLVKMHF